VLRLAGGLLIAELVLQGFHVLPEVCDLRSLVAQLLLRPLQLLRRVRRQRLRWRRRLLCSGRVLSGHVLRAVQLLVRDTCEQVVVVEPEFVDGSHGSNGSLKYIQRYIGSSQTGEAICSDRAVTAKVSGAAAH
jgi:hypothetical protein